MIPDEISEFFNTIVLPEIITNVNDIFIPRQLIKLSRSREPLPTEQRKLSSYRTRMGTIMEYAVGTAFDRWLQINSEGGLKFCFVSYHDYPDFVLRDNTGEVKIRIEMKSVDLESDEHAARFDAATCLIDAQRDYVLFIAWEWKILNFEGVEYESPYIFSSVLVSAADLAKERDARLVDRGGKIEGETVYVKSSLNGEFVLDPGNYGKLWRIIPKDRLEATDLSNPSKNFVLFLKSIDMRTPKKRTKVNVDRGNQTTLPDDET